MLPQNDDTLVDFLRQHRPSVPSPALDLEAEIMAAVAQEPNFAPPVQRRQLWLVPPAIAAGLLISWAGYSSYTHQKSLQNLPQLEAFIENNWDGLLEDRSNSYPFF